MRNNGFGIRDEELVPGFSFRQTCFLEGVNVFWSLVRIQNVASK